MCKNGVKEAVLVVTLEVKAQYNDCKSQKNVSNLTFTCNFTFNMIKQDISTLLAFTLPYSIFLTISPNPGLLQLPDENLSLSSK